MGVVRIAALLVVAIARDGVATRQVDGSCDALRARLARLHAEIAAVQSNMRRLCDPHRHGDNGVARKNPLQTKGVDRLPLSTGDGWNHCLSFQKNTQWALPSAPFDASVTLPAGAFTVAFRFHLYGMNSPRGFGTMLTYNNKLRFAVSSDMVFYIDLADKSFSIPAAGGYGEGWHHVALSFDSATGLVQGFFDGELKLEKANFETGNTDAATFGPNGIAWFSVFRYAYFDVSDGVWSVTGGDLSPNGQIDDLAVWSRALKPTELRSVMKDGIKRDAALSLWYDFDEGKGSRVRNYGNSGAKFDLMLGQANKLVQSYGIANAFGGTDSIPFTSPTWSSTPVKTCTFFPASQATSRDVGAPTATGFLSKPFMQVQEDKSATFVLQYSHPLGVKSCVSITRLPQQGSIPLDPILYDRPKLCRLTRS